MWRRSLGAPCGALRVALSGQCRTGNVLKWDRGLGKRLLSSEGGAAKSGADLRATRAARMRQVAQTNSSKSGAKGKAPKEEPLLSGTQRTLLGGLVAMMGLATVASMEIKRNPLGSLATMYRGSIIESMTDSIFNRGWFESVYQPHSEQLIPTYESGAFYGPVPDGAPPPPLLVLDLEKTLIGSVHDAKYGWRHVKRPGVQKFIDRLSNYYEIVIFSENEKNMDIFEAIDPQNKCHKFGAESAESRNGVMLKRLDYMNRDMSRIVLIDDSEETSSLFPRNTLIIRPFSDINDKSDTALLELLPLLQALVHDGVTDFRKTFDDLGTNDATEATLEYRMRVSKAKEGIREKRRKGLGSLLSKRVDARTGGGSSDGGWDAEGGGGGGGESLLSRIVGDAPVGTASMAGMDASGKQSTTIIDLAGTGAGAHTKVGASTDASSSSKKRVKKKGALFQWLEDSQQESEKIRELKMQRMNEIHMEKMQKKEAAARGK